MRTPIQYATQMVEEQLSSLAPYVLVRVALYATVALADGTQRVVNAVIAPETGQYSVPGKIVQAMAPTQTQN